MSSCLKIWIFWQNLDFWWKFEFLSKCPVVSKFGFFVKMSIFSQNFDFWSKFGFLVKILILVKMSFFWPNFNFFQKINYQKMSKFDKLSHILFSYNMNTICIIYNILIVFNLIRYQFYQTSYDFLCQIWHMFYEICYLPIHESPGCQIVAKY